jgi:hypothetical protein
MGDSVVFGASSKEADIRDKLRSGRDGFRTGTGFGRKEGTFRGGRTPDLPEDLAWQRTRFLGRYRRIFRFICGLTKARHWLERVNTRLPGKTTSESGADGGRHNL